MPRDRTRAAYRRLLRLYPRSFRERFGHSMEQTFDDLRRERSGKPGFVVWMFAETAIGAMRANGVAMSHLRLAPHHRFALVALVLFLPVAVVFPSIWLDVAFVRDLLTVDGDRPSVIGWAVIVGGLLLLPVAFAVALLPMTRRRRLYVLNLFVCALIAIPIAATLYGIGDEIYRCEIRGIANCD